MKEVRGTHYHTTCEAKITSEIARVFSWVITDGDIIKMSKIVREAILEFRKDVLNTERVNIWYSVKDRTPELNVPVIFRRSNGVVFNGVRDSVNFKDWLKTKNNGEEFLITHFMYSRVMGG